MSNKKVITGSGNLVAGNTSISGVGTVSHTSVSANLVAENASMHGVGTVTPSEIKSALENSTLATAKIYIIMKIVDHIAEKGLVKIDEFIEKINKEFLDDPETINFIIEVINSITSNI